MQRLHISNWTSSYCSYAYKCYTKPATCIKYTAQHFAYMAELQTSQIHTLQLHDNNRQPFGKTMLFPGHCFIKPYDHICMNQKRNSVHKSSPKSMYAYQLLCKHHTWVIFVNYVNAETSVITSIYGSHIVLARWLTCTYYIMHFVFRTVFFYISIGSKMFNLRKRRMVAQIVPYAFTLLFWYEIITRLRQMHKLSFNFF